MAASKNKKVVQTKNPRGRHVDQIEDPDKFYEKHPSWNFGNCDLEKWPFSEESVGQLIWDEILPKLKAWETQTWGEILVVAKKQNHSLGVHDLTPVAQKRLTERYIEHNSIISLTLQGTHRLYGYVIGPVYNILWYDSGHGDNDTCVCRSKLKHT